MKLSRRLALCAPICIAASFITAGSASAAVISVSVAALSTTSTTQLLNTGTKVFAWDVAGDVASTTVNGIPFSNAQPVTGEGAVTTAGWNTFLNFATASYSDAGMKEVLGDVFGTNQNANGTLTLNGLTVGQQYRIQFLHYQEGTTASAREMQIRFGTTASPDTTGIFAPGGPGNGYISTFNFTADTATQLFTFQTGGSGADDRSLLNAATLYAVPEPSAALLGGLGMLALLRRRRA